MTGGSSKGHRSLGPLLRPTIRIRLTLLYGGMFLIAGIFLLSIIYALSMQALQQGGDPLFTLLPGSTVQFTSNTCPGLESGQSAAQANGTLSQCMHRQSDLALEDLLRRSLFALLGLSIIAFAFGYAMA
ncbi:two-component sensor histidine kinase, partial [Streptomyces sp. NPDC094049]